MLAERLFEEAMQEEGFYVRKGDFLNTKLLKVIESKLNSCYHEIKAEVRYEIFITETFIRKMFRLKPGNFLPPAQNDGAPGEE